MDLEKLCLIYTSINFLIYSFTKFNQKIDLKLTGQELLNPAATKLERFPEKKTFDATQTF